MTINTFSPISRSFCSHEGSPDELFYLGHNGSSTSTPCSTMSGSRFSPLSPSESSHLTWHAVCKNCIDEWLGLTGKGCTDCGTLSDRSVYRKDITDPVARKVHLGYANFYKNKLLEAVEKNEVKTVIGLIPSFIRAGGAVTPQLMQALESSKSSPEMVDVFVEAGGNVSWRILKNSLAFSYPKEIQEKIFHRFLDECIQKGILIKADELSEIFGSKSFQMPEDADLLAKTIIAGGDLSIDILSVILHSNRQNKDTLIACLDNLLRQKKIDLRSLILDVLKSKSSSLPLVRFLVRELEFQGEKDPLEFLYHAVEGKRDPQIIDFLLGRQLKGHNNDWEDFLWSVLMHPLGSLNVIQSMVYKFEQEGGKIPLQVIEDILSRGFELEKKQFFIENLIEKPDFPCSESVLLKALDCRLSFHTIKKLIDRLPSHVCSFLALRACVSSPNSVETLKYIRQKGGVIELKHIYDAIFFESVDEEVIKYAILSYRETVQDQRLFKIQMLKVFEQRRFSFEMFQFFIQEIFQTADSGILEAILSGFFVSEEKRPKPGLSRESRFLISYLLTVGREKEVVRVLTSLSASNPNLWRLIVLFNEEEGTFSPDLLLKTIKEVSFPEEEVDISLFFLDMFSKKGGKVTPDLLKEMFKISFRCKKTELELDKWVDLFLLSGEPITFDLLRGIFYYSGFCKQTERLLKEFVLREGEVTASLLSLVESYSLEAVKFLMDQKNA